MFALFLYKLCLRALLVMCDVMLCGLCCDVVCVFVVVLLCFVWMLFCVCVCVFVSVCLCGRLCFIV